MNSAHLPAPERVPFRGTYYVNAREYDAATSVADRLTRENEELKRKNGELLREVADLRFPPKPARRPGIFARIFQR